MNTQAIAHAVKHGANAKKLDSIDNRLRKLLADMRKQGVTMSEVDDRFILKHTHSETNRMGKGAKHIVCLGTYEP